MSTLTLASDTLATTPAAGSIEYNGQFYTTDSTAARAQVERISLSSSVTTTGSSVTLDLNNVVPVWAKKITVSLWGVSQAAATELLLQFGTGTTPTWVTSGYLSTAHTGSTGATSTAGFVIQGNAAINQASMGNVIIVNPTGTTWVSSGVVADSATARVNMSAGNITVGAQITSVRLNTRSATTFTAGTMVLLFEG